MTSRHGTASPRARRPVTAARGSAPRSPRGPIKFDSGQLGFGTGASTEVTTGSNVYTTPPLTEPGKTYTLLLPDPPVHAGLDPGQGPRSAEAEQLAAAGDQVHPMTSPAPLVTGTDFITVGTKDFDAAVAFYGTVLGLPESKRWGQMPAAEFETGNLTHRRDGVRGVRARVPGQQPPDRAARRRRRGRPCRARVTRRRVQRRHARLRRLPPGVLRRIRTATRWRFTIATRHLPPPTDGGRTQALVSSRSCSSSWAFNSMSLWRHSAARYTHAISPVRWIRRKSP